MKIIIIIIIIIVSSNTIRLLRYFIVSYDINTGYSYIYFNIESILPIIFIGFRCGTFLESAVAGVIIS